MTASCEWCLINPRRWPKSAPRKLEARAQWLADQPPEHMAQPRAKESDAWAEALAQQFSTPPAATYKPRVALPVQALLLVPR